MPPPFFSSRSPHTCVASAWFPRARKYVPDSGLCLSSYLLWRAYETRIDGQSGGTRRCVVATGRARQHKTKRQTRSGLSIHETTILWRERIELVIDCLTTIVTAAIALVTARVIAPAGVKRVSWRTEKESKHNDDQRDFHREGHYLHSTWMLRDDASHRLGDSDVGISLERWESEYQGDHLSILPIMAIIIVWRERFISFLLISLNEATGLFKVLF